MVSPLVLPMKDPKWAKLYWTLVLARYARWSGQSAIDRTNLRKRIRGRGRVRVRLWERLCACPDLTDTNFGLIALLLVSCLVTRTFCYAQEIIRHKRTTSRAARGPLPFIPFIS